MSEVIYETLVATCGLKKANLPAEWKATIDSFLNDSSNSRLLLVPGDRAAARIVLNPSKSDLASAGNVVFIKTGSAPGNSVQVKSSEVGL